jgi:hypothetical protein
MRQQEARGVHGADQGPGGRHSQAKRDVGSYRPRQEKMIYGVHRGIPDHLEEAQRYVLDDHAAKAERHDHRQSANLHRHGIELRDSQINEDNVIDQIYADNLD